MKITKSYLKHYLAATEESFKKWGYYYPPRNHEELLVWEHNTHKEHLADQIEGSTIKTTLHVRLLCDLNVFAYLQAFEQDDCALLNKAIWQNARHKLLDSATIVSGADHCSLLPEALAAFACNDFGIIDHFFPLTLPHSAGHFYTENAVNLLKVIYYSQDDLQTEAIAKARHFLETGRPGHGIGKLTLWERYVVLYFIALVQRDDNAASEYLQQLCLAHQKRGYLMKKVEKCFAIEVHGLYHCARLLGEDFFAKLIRPKHASFCEEFEIWQAENSYPRGEQWRVYPAELDYMNKVLAAPLPYMHLIEYRDAGRIKFQKDVERFKTDLANNVNAKLCPA